MALFNPEFKPPHSHDIWTLAAFYIKNNPHFSLSPYHEESNATFKNTFPVKTKADMLMISSSR